MVASKLKSIVVFDFISMPLLLVFLSILWTGTIVSGLKIGGRQINNHRSTLVKRPISSSGSEVPIICKTLKAQEFDLPQGGESPYEIVVNRIAPSVYEVTIQGKHGELFTDFVLAITSPYQGEFSKGRYESFKCDVTNPDKETLIRAPETNRFALKRQAVAHFYPRKASGKVTFRGSVYFNQTTLWNVENDSLRFAVQRN